MKSMRPHSLTALAFALLVPALACGNPDVTGAGGPVGGNSGGGANAGGGGNAGGGMQLPDIPVGGNNGGGGRGGGQDCGFVLATIRDFNRTHPDFETFYGGTVTPGLVQPTLGADNKPVFAGKCTMPFISDECPFSQQLTSKERFDEWYRDVDGVNKRVEKRFELTKDNQTGSFYYENNSFFPIDTEGFAELTMGHNFHFTTEIHGTFKYKGGETFRFKGDDDVWVFINGRLAIDVGGLHPSQDRTANFDQLKGALGIEVGTEYSLDIFHAERHTGDSNFRIETSIECLKTMPIQ